MIRIKLLLLLLGLPICLLGQGADTTYTFALEDIRTPASPVFSLLGGEPSSMTRPGTPRGLATTLLSGANLEAWRQIYFGLQ